MRPLVAFVAAFLLALAAPIPARAQDPAAEPPEAAATVAALRGRIAQLETLSGQLGGEDLEIQRNQLRRTTERLSAALDELVAAVTAAAEEEAPPEEPSAPEGEAPPEEPSAPEGEAPRAVALETATWLGERLRGEYEAAEAGLRELRAGRHAAEDAAAVHAEIARLEGRSGDALGDYAANLARLEALGAEGDGGWLVDELRRRSEVDAARLELRKARLDALAKQLAEAPEARKAELQEELAAARARLDSALRVLDGTLALMEARELDVTELRKVRLASMGELEIQDVSVGVLLGLLEGWGERLMDTLIEEGPAWAFKAILFLAILTFFFLLSRLVRRLVRKAVSSSRLHVSKLLREFFVGTAGKAVLVIGLLIALSQLGFELGPILAGFGIAGFVVGFALQETLSNFAAGMMILIYRPFDEGDVVSVAGVSGLVHEMSLVSTTILTFDNQDLIVPNSKIWGDVITNVTARSTRRVDLVFSIGYADDIPKAERILREVVTAHPKVLKEPEPVVRLSALGDSSVDFIVRPWAATSDYWEVHWDVTRAVKLRFDEEGVTIPFPQRDVHVYHERPGPERPPVGDLPPQPTGAGRPFDPEGSGEPGEPAEDASRPG